MPASEINILKNASIHNCTNCIHDSKRGYYVRWPDNNDLNGYSGVSGITSYTVWDGVYFGVSNSTSCYISQDSDISVNGSYYTIVKIKMRLDKGHHLNEPLTGKVQFLTSSEVSWDSNKEVEFDITADNAYNEYSVPMDINPYWSGTISRFRVYPFIDGYEGIKIHIKSIEIVSREKYSCDSLYGSSLCDRYSQYSHPCPWIGSPGSSSSVALEDGITITEGVNDKLLVNIDSYGAQSIKLRPVVGTSINNISRDIQDKLNLVGVGGYAFARCYVDEYKLKIESDWHSYSSSVVVTQPSECSACVTLGFFDSLGNKTATEQTGTDSASMYERAPLQLNSSQLRYLKGASVDNNKSVFSIDGSNYTTQGGNKGYRTVVKDNKLSFRNKTLIDYNNPISNNGVITFIGYSGDSFSNTSFRVYRQKLDGSLTIVHTVDMSSSPEDTDGIYEKSDIALKVKRGDLIGIYSASLHTGNDYRRENYSYYLFNSDLSTVAYAPRLYGSGEYGLPLFVRSSHKADNAVIDIEFDNAQLIESIVVYADESTPDEEINLCTVRSGGAGGGPYVEGFTGLGEDGTQAPDLADVDAVIDGEKQDINGTSEYCYPGWLTLLPAEQLNYQYTDFGLTFDFAKGIDVYFPINKIKTYFVSNKNIKSFMWQVPIATNLTDTSRIWGIGWDSYTSVITDDGLLDPSGVYLYNNPSLVVAGDYQTSYSHLNYKYLELIFSPFNCRSLRFNASLGEDYEDDTLQLSYAKFPIAPDPKIQEIEVFSTSTPSKNMSSCFSLETSKDGSTYITHDDIDVVSSTNAKYTLGRPVRHIRFNISTDSVLDINRIYAVLSEDVVGVETNYKGVVALNSPVDRSSLNPEEIVVTNDSGTTCNFYVDILEESAKSERCLLWNMLDDDNGLSESEIGPGGIVRRRSNINLRPINYAYGCDAYYLDKNFVNGKTAYLSLDAKNTWTSLGSLVTDGSSSSYITNENSLFHMYDTIFVALDLGDNYAISSVELNGVSGELGFDSSVLYSTKDTGDPSTIPTVISDPEAWSIGSKGNARWVLFSAPAVNIGGAGIRYLSYVRVNIDLFDSTNSGKIPWVSAKGYLTNGSSGYTSGGEGWITDGFADYYCVDLKWWHNVTNVITGPFSSSVASIYDTSSILPGEWPSVVGSDASGTDVAYSSSSTSDPGDVSWGSFGGAPDNPTKWVLIRAIDSRVEEIIVHIDDNDESVKKSFINSGWVSTSSVSAYEEYAHTKSGICAIAMDYPENSIGTEFIQIRQNFDVDEEMSPRDSLGFWFYVSDASQLDFSTGYFRIGKSLTQENTPLDANLTPDTYNYYEWPLSLMSDIILSGWNYLSLPMSDNYKNGILYFAQDDKTREGTAAYSNRDRITNITFLFKGVDNNDSFTVRLDDFRILRRYYSEVNFGYGAYVPYSEYIKFGLNDFDPNKGTIEFYLKSDWSRSFLCNSCKDPRDHTILRVFSSEDDTVFGIYMTGEGLKFYVTDGEESAIVTDDSAHAIISDRPVHVAFSWDFKDEYGSCPPMCIYINGVPSVNMEYSYLSDNNIEFNFSQQSFYSMVIGALGWSGVISSFASSADSVIENLKVFNYPLNNFEYSMSNQGIKQAKRSSDLIELSLDGVNYYGSSTRGTNLPLLKKGVADDESFYIYVRGKDWDDTALGEKNRKSFITLTRTPA